MHMNYIFLILPIETSKRAFDRTRVSVFNFSITVGVKIIGHSGIKFGPDLHLGKPQFSSLVNFLLMI